MCLAIPMKLVTREGDRGAVETGGVRRDIMLTFVPDAVPGNYLIVHAGYALELLDEESARETLALLREIGETGE
ncbi:HypC/HybG/HupF family hydrogenase formation chaperone [bacterium]|nr:HypC/HybG/HupF family hydrogenase formation chaperone [bacterium]MBU1638449.1 HypC/HybG/HupF family hydrogenase formation chaperone [bacterium]MBU1920370.1 HypC/HybG/HupF family hydrogenase formation chaperone [bacterium]